MTGRGLRIIVVLTIVFCGGCVFRSGESVGDRAGRVRFDDARHPGRIRDNQEGHSR